MAAEKNEEEVEGILVVAEWWWKVCSFMDAAKSINF